MMREKHRYILVESAVEVPEEARKGFEVELSRELMHNIGEVHYFRANMRIVKHVGLRRFVIRCSLERHNDVIVALSFIKRIGGADTGFYTLKSSGTIRALLKDDAAEEPGKG